MKKLIHIVTLFSIAVIFNSCNCKEKEYKKELELIKAELKKEKESKEELHKMLSTYNITDEAVAKGGKVIDGKAKYELLVPVGFKTISPPTYNSDENTIFHYIEPIDDKSRYSDKNEKESYSIAIKSNAKCVEIISEIETVFGNKSNNDDPIAKRHKRSIITGG